MTTPNSGGYPPSGEDPQGGTNGAQGDLPSYGDYSAGRGQPAAGEPGAYPGYQGYQGYQDTTGAYPAYQPGNEYAQFDVNSAADVAGRTAVDFHGQPLADGFYGDGTQAHPINNPEVNGWSHLKGTGKLRAGEAISWALKAIGQNTAFWLVLGLITAALNTLPSVPQIPGVVGLLLSLASFFLAPVFVAAALQQTLVTKFNSPKAPAYGKTLGMLALLVFIGAVVGFLLMLVGTLVGASTIDIDPSTVPSDPEAMLQDETMVEQFVQSMGIAMLVMTVLLILLLPFVAFPLFYAADNNGSFGTAFKEGVKAGTRNYLPTLGLLVFSVLLGAVAQVPIFLVGAGVLPAAAGVILAFVLTALVSPITLLLAANAYRQVSGGPVPRVPAQAL